jgi:TolB-like protein
MSDFLQRLKQRKLVQWALAYVAAAFALLQGIDIVAQRFAWPETVERILIIAICVGFFVTLLLAWYHGEKGRQRASGTELLLIALVLAVGGGLLWKFAAVAPEAQRNVANGPAAVIRPQTVTVPAVNPKSIAVLPFDNLSADKDSAYFADGLSVEIIDSLSRVPDLAVAARTSSFAFRGSKLTVPEIARKLGVATVLEGSVRSAGKHLRISAQLIRAADGFELWSDSYDRDSSDIITIQEDVARSIAQALKTATDPKALAAMQRAGTRSVPAYQAYLQGLALLNGDAARQGDLSVEPAAQSAFDRAIAIDPQFVDAYVQSANLQLSMLQPSVIGSPAANATYGTRLQRLRDDLDHASALARNTAEKHFYAALRASVDQQYLEAIRLMSDYVHKYPNDAAALQHLSEWSLAAGDYAGSRKWSEALLKDTDSSAQNSVVPDLVWAGDFPRAAAVARRDLRARPDNMAGMYQAHRALLSAGDVQAAAQLVPRLLASKLPAGSKMVVEVRQACAEGRTRDADRLLAQLKPGDSDYVSPHWLALNLLGRDDEAAKLLDFMDTPVYFNALSSYLLYPQFDVTRYPNLQAVLTAQGIHRPPAKLPPFACNGKVPDE